MGIVELRIEFLDPGERVIISPPSQTGKGSLRLKPRQFYNQITLCVNSFNMVPFRRKPLVTPS